jgi:hypothetical protein
MYNEIDVFSAGQDFTGSTGGTLSTYAKHLHGRMRLGVGRPVFLEGVVTVAFTGAGDSLDLDLVADSLLADGVTLAGSYTLLKQALFTIPAESAIGYKFCVQLPDVEITAGDVAIAIRGYARGSGAISTGSASMWLTLEPGQVVIMPRGDVVG